MSLSTKGMSGGNWSTGDQAAFASAPPQRGQPLPPPIPSSAPSYQSNSSAGGDVQMLMDQVRQLQQKVTELSSSKGTTKAGQFEAEQPQFNNQSILLVSNLPPSLATCDALFFMFDRFVVLVIFMFFKHKVFFLRFFPSAILYMSEMIISFKKVRICRAR